MPPNTSLPVSARARAPLFPEPEPDDLSSYVHRQSIGGLGMALPVLVWLIAGWRPTEGLQRWRMLGSVSAYYYTGSVAAFVGILFALAVFLFTYRGYDNEHGRRDRIAAIIAGAAALLVAFFPTDAPSGLTVPSWWTSVTGTIHFTAAAILFCTFSFFSLFLFPMSKVKAGAPLPPDKRARNAIYVSCGVAMLVCILWAAGASLAHAPIFWPEALALEFFAASWLVKGRADRTAVTACWRTLHYGRHPGELVDTVLSAVRGAPRKDSPPRARK
jgi:hypothetical protein